MRKCIDKGGYVQKIDNIKWYSGERNYHVKTATFELAADFFRAIRSFQQFQQYLTESKIPMPNEMLSSTSWNISYIFTRDTSVSSNIRCTSETVILNRQDRMNPVKCVGYAYRVRQFLRYSAPKKNYPKGILPKSFMTYMWSDLMKTPGLVENQFEVITSL